MRNQHIFTISPLTQPENLKQVMELQALVFGDAPINHIPLPTLMNYHYNGQHLLGIFEDDQLFGFAMAYFGTYNRDPERPAMANLKLVLERIAVHPDYRNIGLGTQLMRNLREHAVRQAVRLVTAAFSPLNGRMANLMIRKLGAVIQYYVPDYFDPEIFVDYASPTSGQVVAEWWLTKNRVEERLFGERALLTLDQYLDANTPIINPTSTSAQELPMPSEDAPHIDNESMILVEIPADYDALAQRDTKLAVAWCDHIQAVMQMAFEQGYIATDFLYGEYHGRLRSFYLMSYDGPRIRFTFEAETPPTDAPDDDDEQA